MADVRTGRSRLGFGVSAGLPGAVLAPLAAAVRDLGYESFWVNDAAREGADGLADLALVAKAAPELRLGVGVVPLDRRPPERIASDVARLGLPLDRLRLGIGSGAEAGRPLALVRDGLAALADALPGATLFIAALGSRMCRLGGEAADGVLLNWALPSRIATSREIIAAGARAAGRDPAAVEVWSYVRTALGDDAPDRLAAEAGRYAQTPAYGRQFREMGAPLSLVGVAGGDVAGQLWPYRAELDGVVVRALPVAPGLGALLDIARAASPD